MKKKPTYKELEQKIIRLEKEAAQLKQTGETPEVARNIVERDELISLFNLSVDMLCTADINGCFRTINKSWETILGYTREELLSKPYIDFVHPDDVELTLAEGARLLQGQRSIIFENRYRCKDGSYKWLSWTSSPHPKTGITYAVACDISEKKQAEEELKKHRDHLEEMVAEQTKDLQKVNEELQAEISEHKRALDALQKSEERYRRLTENAKDMIYRMFLPDGIYEYVSSASIDIFGYSPEEWYNSPKLIQKIIHPDWQDYFNEQWENLIAGNMSPIYEYQIIHKSGETKWIHQSNVLVRDDKGQPIAIEGIVTDITERKLAEEELQKLASVVRYSSELVNLSTLDGKMIFLNNAGCKMLGIEPEEVEQANIMDVIPDHLVDMVKKDILPALMDNRTWKGDLQYRNIKTGKLIYVHSMTFTIQDQITGKPLYFANVSLDITDRKQAEKALRQSEEKYHLLVENTPSVLWKTSEKGATVFISINIEEVYGYTPEEIYSDGYNSWLGRIHHDDLQEVQKRFQALFDKGKKFDLEYRIKRRDGKWIWVHDAASVVLEENGERYAYGVFTDITDRKQAEKELAKYRNHLEQLVEERTRELKEAQAELVAQEEFATIGRMSATVSHEIRNPLGTILTSYYLIVQRTKGKDIGIEQALDRIKRNISRCDNIIEEFLEYSRIHDLNKIKTSIDEWLKHELERQAIPNDIRVIGEFSSGIEVMLDRERFSQCCKSIIDNSVQALQGEVRELNENDKGIQEKLLIAGSHVAGNRLVIEVRDSGPGIPHDEMGKILEPLFSTKGFGVGLGLPIAIQIMKQHGGGIEVKSEFGKGTVVKLWLPVDENK